MTIAPCVIGDVVTTDIVGYYGCNDEPGESYDYTSSFSGTSAAAPQVAGVAALLLSREPGLTLAQVKSRLYGAAQPWGPSTRFGSGKVDAYHTLVPRLAVYIAGDVFPPSAGTYTYTARLSGAVGNYCYRWERSSDGGGTFTDTGVTTQSIDQFVTSSGVVLRVTVTSGTEQAVATQDIQIEPPCGGGTAC